MSKRYGTYSMHGETKKAKLDVIVSDHNFPMSQNNQDENQWGDDDDDEILLLASQACEAYTDDNIQSLPDFNQFMEPVITSTPYEPQPSTSKPFTFKVPSSTPSTPSTVLLKNTINGLSQSMHTNNCLTTINTNKDDFAVNNNICKDCGQIYKQLMEFRSENAKLKSENGKLLEKCVTNDGEVSILRSQLKTCQVAVDSARMEKVKVQERVQMEFAEKLGASKNELCDLRSQLDFKNLEVVSLKERCKMLESSKIKLTQVTVGVNDISMSQRNNFAIPNNVQTKRKVTSSAAQTECKKDLLQLNKRCYFENQNLKKILPLILQETTEKEISLLHYNEKLRKSNDMSQTKCRIFSTFHGISTTLSNPSRVTKKITLNSIYLDLSVIASECFSENLVSRYVNVFQQIRSIYSQLLNELECITQRVTAAFQREMDEKYIEATTMFYDVNCNNLLCANSLYKDEQSILSRRATAVLFHTIKCERTANIWYTLTDDCDQQNSNDEQNEHCITLLCRICKLIDRASCAVLYSGFLLSLTFLMQSMYNYINTTDFYTKLLEIIKCIVTARPMPMVVCGLLDVLRKMAAKDGFLNSICMRRASGNMMLDYDQGVMLFKNESCTIQIFLKQMEATLKIIEQQNKIQQIIITTQNLLSLYGNINCYNPNWAQEQKSNRCDCAALMMQIIVYALHICANILRSLNEQDSKEKLSCICRCGITLLYQWVLRDVEFSTHLGFYEGHYHIFIENCDHMKDVIVIDELQGAMLSELLCTLQPSCEDLELPASNCKEVWMDSFNHFTISD